MSEARKINGKTAQEVLEALKVPFENCSVDFNGNSIIPYEAIRQRANDILGLNYSDRIDVAYQEIEGEHNVRVTCTISIYDDEGKVVAERSHMRSDVLTRYKNNNKLSFDNDDFSSVVSLAFKKAFSMFGLGAQFAIENAEKSMNHMVKNFKKGQPETEKRKVKGYLTFVSKMVNDGVESYSFQGVDGKSIEFVVPNPEEVKNYQKLAAMTPGSSAQVIFIVPDCTLVKVE